MTLSPARRRVIAAVVGVIGLVVIWQVTLRAVYRKHGFDPERDVGDADCDQCQLTEFLDALPYLAVAVVAYLVVFGLLWLVLRRRNVL